MYAESSYPRGGGDTASIVLGTVSGDNAVCVTFWYYMWGRKMGSLTLRQVYLDGRPDTVLTGISGGHGGHVPNYIIIQCGERRYTQLHIQCAEIWTKVRIAL